LPPTGPSPSFRRMTTTHTAFERFLISRGKTIPPPLTDAERAKMEADERRADEEIERLYGPRRDAP